MARKRRKLNKEMEAQIAAAQQAQMCLPLMLGQHDNMWAYGRPIDAFRGAVQHTLCIQRQHIETCGHGACNHAHASRA